MAIDFDALVLGPCRDTFGEKATYKPATGASFAISGVFDEAYRELTLLDTGDATSSDIPVLGVRLADFPAPPAQNDKLTIVSVNSTFIVKEVRPDGHGWAKLMLNFVSSP